MFKNFKALLFGATLISMGSLSASETNAKGSDEKKGLGIVNFTQCLIESNYGKEEREAFENLKMQMSSLIEDCAKQLQDIEAKRSDEDYLAGLSPAAEEELMAKHQSLLEEYNRYQNQAMQVMNQANMKMLNSVHQRVNQAAALVASQENYAMIMNGEAAFYYTKSDDVTPLVIKEMNRDYEKNKKSVGMQPPVEKK